MKYVLRIIRKDKIMKKEEFNENNIDELFKLIKKNESEKSSNIVGYYIQKEDS